MMNGRNTLKMNIVKLERGTKMDNKREMILNSNLWGLIGKFSVPTIFILLVNATYNLVDAIFIGNQPNGDMGIAGLTIVFPIQMLIFSFGLMVGVGSAAIISRSIGKKDFDTAKKIIGNAFILIFIIGIIITAICIVFNKPLLYTFGCTKKLFPYAHSYFSIILIGNVVYLLAVTSNCIVRSQGKMLVSMFIMVFSSLINIPTDYLFVVVLNKGIQGAALATIISQTTCLISFVIYFIIAKGDMKIKLSNIRLYKGWSKKIMVSGSPSIINNAVNALVAIVILNSIKLYGEEIHITILGIYNRTFTLIFLPMIGIMQAIQPIIGVNYGAKQFKRVKQTISNSIIIVCSIGLVGLIIYYIFTGNIIAAFSKNLDIVNIGTRPIRILITMLPIIGIQIICGGYYQAIGKVKYSIVIGLSRPFFLIVAIGILPLIYSMQGIWYSVPTADLCAAITTIIVVIYASRRSRSKGYTDETDMVNS